MTAPAFFKDFRLTLVPALGLALALALLTLGLIFGATAAHSSSGSGPPPGPPGQQTEPTATPAPPDAPGTPAVARYANTDGQTGLTVTWTAPNDNGSAITGYDVQYRKKGATDWSQDAQDVAGPSHDIIGLGFATTTYEVQVKAKSDAGDSDWSASGEGTTNTAPSFPEDAVSSLTVPADSVAETAVGDPVTAIDADADADDTLTYTITDGAILCIIFQYQRYHC